MVIPDSLLKPRQTGEPWDVSAVHTVLGEQGNDASQRTTERFLEHSGLVPAAMRPVDARDEHDQLTTQLVTKALEADARQRREPVLVMQFYRPKADHLMLFANDGRMGRSWLFLSREGPTDQELTDAVGKLVAGRRVMLWPHGELTTAFRRLVPAGAPAELTFSDGGSARIALAAYGPGPLPAPGPARAPNDEALSQLDRLEAEAMYIIREAVAQAERPVMLYSVGKDSAVLLHLARKAFAPGVPPFPLLHVDTRWKFRAMYRFRDQVPAATGMELLVHQNPDGVAKNINPFDHGSAIHTDIMKTQALKQALDQHGFDLAFGGARRDEEKSRAKERVFSFRTASHRWDPKRQRPELWHLYNGRKQPGESLRVFPLSNWTELDIWQYIYREGIPLVPLYYADYRPVVERDGMLLMVDDDRMRLLAGERVEVRQVRFRTLGCYPLTGAVESDATTLGAVVLEVLRSRSSERQGRAIDADSTASMEKKKQEGYF